MSPGALRFAMVTTYYPPYNFGGDGQYVRRLSHSLARRGHQVDVIHDVDAFDMFNNGTEPHPEPEPEGVRTYPLRSSLGFFSCLATQQLGRPLVHGREIKRILNQNYDVIHFHNISLVGGPGILSYGKGIKLYTTHEHWLVCPSHILWRHNREACPGRQCLRCVLRHRRPPQLWRYGSFLKNQSRHIDAFLTLSHFSAEKHKEFGFEQPMKVIPSFLPESEGVGLSDKPLPRIPQERPYFLFIGRLEVIKGLQDVIPLIKDDGPADLWIAGSGNYEPELRRLAEGRRSIRFLGQQSPERVRELSRNAIAVVTPSCCFEVFPMVVLEALREETPIIARRLGPYPEIVNQSGGGLLFDTVDELQSALTKLATDTPFRDKLGKTGARAYQAKWSEDVALKAYFDLIHDTAKARRLDQVVAKFPAQR